MRTFVAFVALAAILAPASAQTIRTLRVPDGGIQPQAVMAADGTLHLLYYKGNPQAGDLFYVKRAAGKTDFSGPIRVNSQPGSAVAVGNDRGGQIALGKNNRPHIAWNGSSKAEPKGARSPAFSAENPNNGLPMLYTRLNDKGNAFEPQRNVMTDTFGLDGGGSIAANGKGWVYMVFHADPASASGKSEAERRVFVARSTDDGATFSSENPVSSPDLGTCGCCGLKSAADSGSQVWILFRTATGGDHRDTTLLWSSDCGQKFQALPLHPWQIASCPMSTAAIAPIDDRRTAFAWETRDDVFLKVVDAGPVSLMQQMEPSSPSGGSGKRKYPALAVGSEGILMAWTEGMSWGKGGSVHWQVFDVLGSPKKGTAGHAEGVPAWSLVAAIAEPDGSFTVLY